MKTIILGAGIIGISTAWHLRARGHDVIVIDRRAEAAQETSFANAGQISVSYCEPWANREAPLKALKWMFDAQAPLLFRPQLDWQQWRWALQFLGQCNDRAFARNVQQIVALGTYSHTALQQMVAETGISYHRLERGIAHFYSSAQAFEEAGEAVEIMRQHGVQRQLVSRDELLRIEPAFTPYKDQIFGGTFTPTDESGDARAFTQQLAQLCAQRGVQFLYGHDVLRLNQAGGEVQSITVRQRLDDGPGREQTLTADSFVVACGSYSAPLLRTVGVDLPIYPGKGYSATFRILRPDAAPFVSCIDDARKIAMSRFGDQLRVAGTIELGGFDLSLDSTVAQARCRMLSERIEEILPGVCDTRSEAEGGQPNYWCGLRPATPTNIPFIGHTGVGRLWVNAGHGTLGWTHGAGSGKALAALISGERPAMDFGFLGQGRDPVAWHQRPVEA